MERNKKTINWTKEKTLGTGAFGTVTLWRNELNGEQIAIKFLRETENPSQNRNYKERWLKEIDIMKRLNHDNLVKVVPVPEELQKFALKFPLLCMEYCSEGDLRSVLNKPENCCGLQEAVVRRIVQNIKDAVEYLHGTGITHRDIKPENIVLQKIDDAIVYKLIDLGFGMELGKSSWNESFVWTLQYIAPEVFSHMLGPSVDYWSLGLVVHEIITGIRPFLPNMLPYTWLPLVKEKRYEDICIYQSAAGTIEYCSTLSKEIHLTHFLRDEFEVWLRSALEWNCWKRGRGTHNKITIFSTIDEILDKKIITIFSPVAFKQLSYEVDNSTLFSTVMRWIERDSKQMVDDQLILLPNGDNVSEDALARTCWDPSTEVAMAYVYTKKGLQIPADHCEIPDLVVQMIEDTKQTLPFHIIIRMWAKSIHFIQSQLFLFTSTVESYAAKLLFILRQIEQASRLQEIVATEGQQSRGQYKLLCATVQYNIRKIETIDFNKEHALKFQTNWEHNLKSLDQHLIELENHINDTKVKLSCVRYSFDKFDTVYGSTGDRLDDFKTLLTTGYKLYEGLQRMPKQLRKSETSPTEMVSLIYRSLEVRHQLLTDPQLKDDLKKINECESGLVCLQSSLEDLLKKVKAVTSNIFEMNTALLRDTWVIANQKMINPKPGHGTSQVYQGVSLNQNKRTAVESNSFNSNSVPHVVASSREFREAVEDQMTKYKFRQQNMAKSDAIDPELQDLIKSITIG